MEVQPNVFWASRDTLHRISFHRYEQCETEAPGNSSSQVHFFPSWEACILDQGSISLCKFAHKWLNVLSLTLKSSAQDSQESIFLHAFRKKRNCTLLKFERLYPVTNFHCDFERYYIKLITRLKKVKMKRGSKKMLLVLSRLNELPLLPCCFPAARMLFCEGSLWW